MGNISWKVWVFRWVLSLITTAGIAWLVSFAVADYVVRANTSSNIETMRSLQSSIDRLNESVIANSGRMDTFGANVMTLMERSATAVTEIAAMREDITKVQRAVQGAGIQIRVGEQPEGKVLDWNELKAYYGLKKDTPVYLGIHTVD